MAQPIDKNVQSFVQAAMKQHDNELAKVLKESVALQKEAVALQKGKPGEDAKDEALKSITRITQFYSNGMGSIFSKQRINYELSRLNPFTSRVYGGITQGIQQQDELNTRMGGMGRNLGDFRKSQGLMSGGMGGFQNQIEAQTNFAIAGFKAIGQPMRDLAAGMKLTGQDQGKLVQALRQANQMGGVSIEGTSRLSMTLDRTTKEYGVQTEALIDSMGDLQDSMTTNLLGTSEALDTALIELTGKYGAGAGPMLRELAMQMTDIDNYGHLTVAGLNEHGRLLADSNTSSEKMVSLLEDSIAKISLMAQNTTRSGHDARIGLNQTKNLLGNLGPLANTLNSINKNSKANIDEATDFNQNLEAFKAEMTSPLHELVYGTFGANQKEMVNILSDLKGVLITIAAVTTLGSVAKGGVLLSSGAKGLKQLGALGSLRALLDLPQGSLGEKVVPVGESAGIAQTGVGEAVKKSVAQGGNIATARVGAGIIGGALPWVAGIGAVIGAGWLLSNYLDGREKEAQEKLKGQLNDIQNNIEQKRNALRANSSSGFSNITRASGNTAFEVTNINIQREQAKLMADMIKELKKANGKTQGASVRESGI